MHRRPATVVIVALAITLAAVGVLLAVHARAAASGASRCDRFAAAHVARATAGWTGSGGRRIVVIGDSWSVGLGLPDPGLAWSYALSGRVHVDGFSGSGFSEGASPCGHVSFADRAPAAARGGADLVVVEGGLNDVDQSASAIRVGFRRLTTALSSYAGRLVVVGPPLAPARAAGVPRVDALLRSLCRQYRVRYVSTLGMELTYQRDRLHPDASGAAAFGLAVAERL